MVLAAELIDAFCDQVWLRDGLAASSLQSYRRDLIAWADWLARRGQGDMLCAGRADVEAFLAAQFQRKAKITSINRRLSSLRRFYRLHAEHGSVEADPTLRVKAPKLPRRLPKNLSEAQVDALLDMPGFEDAPTSAIGASVVADDEGKNGPEAAADDMLSDGAPEAVAAAVPAEQLAQLKQNALEKFSVIAVEFDKMGAAYQQLVNPGLTEKDTVLVLTSGTAR